MKLNREDALVWTLVAGFAATLAFLLVACATNPEAQLLRSYQGASASAKTTTVLLNRDVIEADEGQRVLDLVKTAKAQLDDANVRLKACRADQQLDPTIDCDKVVTSVQLGSGVLLEIERFLEQMEKGAAK